MKTRIETNDSPKIGYEFTSVFFTLADGRRIMVSVGDMARISFSPTDISVCARGSLVTDKWVDLCRTEFAKGGQK